MRECGAPGYLWRTPDLLNPRVGLHKYGSREPLKDDEIESWVMISHPIYEQMVNQHQLTRLQLHDDLWEMKLEERTVGHYWRRFLAWLWR